MKSAKSDSQKSLIGGFHPVEELISRTGYLPGDELHVSRDAGKRIFHLVQKARKAGIEVFQDPPEKLTRLLGEDRHQGIILVRKDVIVIPELTDEMIQKGGLFVVLESVQDPGNIGVIARSIAAFGANGLIISKHDSAPIGQSAIKSSAGSLLHIPVMHTARIASFLQNWTNDPEVCILGTTLDGEILTESIAQDFMKRHKIVFLVFGSEQNGLSRLVRERCHFLLKLSQTDVVQSLNVAQAATVFLYEFLKKSR